MDPRIYVYRINFEERPEWYWGVHKEQTYDEYYMGSPTTHKSFWDLYKPLKTILETFEYTQEGWSEALKREKELILPDLSNSLCLNECCAGCFSLKRQSEISKALWKSEEHRDRIRESTRRSVLKLWEDPKYRELHSNKMKRQWEDPSFQEASENNPRGLGTFWVTNGTKEGSMKLRKGSEIPEGFEKGRVLKSRTGH